jgi:N6-L-threonylcarbamoyladenine synthase
MIILGIETSCDETAAALVKDGRTILASVVATQLDTHRPYSGVVPELASRAHVLTLNSVLEHVFQKAKWPFGKKVDAIGVTVGPGLVGALLVGKMTAESLGWVLNRPVVGVNHIEGHLLSSLLDFPHLKPPFLGLVVSGGHTELIHVASWRDIHLLGRTRDDAAGEAFDKVAKMLGLGYPGGPLIDQMAKKGKAQKNPFPRPWLPGSWDFSFSGLKTAVLYKLREKKKWSLSDKQNLCAGFQASVMDILVGKTIAACTQLRLKTIVVGGGVAANSQLRQQLIQAADQKGFSVYLPSLSLCTDNAAMIAASAYYKMRHEKGFKFNQLTIQPQLHLPMSSRRMNPFVPPIN